MMYKYVKCGFKQKHPCNRCIQYVRNYLIYISIYNYIYIYCHNPVVFLSNGPDRVFFWVISALICRKNVVLLPVGLQYSFAFLSGKQAVPTKTERCVFFPIMTRKLWVCGFPGMCMYNYIYILHFIWYIYITITISHITIKYITIYYTYNITITILPYYF